MKMAQLEIKKMKQGMSYSCKEKTIILNVFKYFRMQNPDKCVTEIVRCTAKATGCSEKSIFQFRKEEASAEGFKVPSTTKIRKNININSRDIKYDHTVRQAIRSIIYDLKYKNIVPSLNTILKHVNSDCNTPNFSLMTLRRLLFDMGFCYEKNGNKSVLVEKPLDTKDNCKTVVKKKTVQRPQKTLATTYQNGPSQVPVKLPEHKLMPVHHQMPPQHDMIPPPMHVPHSMPMVLNHGMPPAHPMVHSTMDMHLKREMPWMHHHPTPHTIMKQQ